MGLEATAYYTDDDMVWGTTCPHCNSEITTTGLFEEGLSVECPSCHHEYLPTELVQV